MSKLQLLTTKFENLRMEEYESIHDFHMNVLDCANSFESLGEKISDEKLVRKILRSLPKKFDMKVTAIEEAQDISNMKVDELIGSQQTFEVAMNEKPEYKIKNIAFVSNTEDDEIQSDESLSDAIMCLGKEFNKVLEMMKRKSRPNKGKRFQCFGCEGELDNEAGERVKVLTGICTSDTDSDDDISLEELVASYKQLCARNEEVSKTIYHQKKTIAALQSENTELKKEKKECLGTINDLETEVSVLNCKLESMSKTFKMMNNGTETLDQILQTGRSPKNMEGLGGDYMTKQNPNPKKFVPTQQSHTSTMSGQMLQHPKYHQRSNTKSKFQVWTCHYCGKKGHIKPFCYKLYGFPKRTVQPRNKYAVKKTRKVWKPKEGSSTLNTKAFPITTVPASKITIMKKGTCMPVSGSPSASTNVHFGTDRNNDSPIIVKKPHTMKSLCLDPINPKNVKPNVHTLGQSSKNVAIVDGHVVESVNFGPLDSPTEVVDSIVGSPKETLSKSNVMSDVSTSLTQSSGQKNVSTGTANDMPASVEKDVGVVDQDQQAITGSSIGCTLICSTTQIFMMLRAS
ncbi:gag-pol polyprotein [Trifolium medium]|uniref:Gag-pol polyprotein n=1 Tax=Trifolium medium TaxID=97028 RepID=A0A392M0A2_9FABA|nr:gag-pol polyprotein [Trifolium medium]